MYANFETVKGNIKVELLYKAAPMTVANFVGLAEGTIKNTAKAEGVPYFDGLKFHRVITKGNGDAQDFMIQGGDPQGTGQGGPGYKFANEIVDSLKFDKPGILAMANAGPHTNGSQFFITVAATPQLDGAYSIFGSVVEGQDIVNLIKKDDVMTKVTIIREGKEAKAFDAASVFTKATEQAKKDDELAALNDAKAFEAFVAKNYPNATKTPSGMYYVHTVVGTGKSPAATDKVKVHYEGKFLDGNIFDSSIQRGEPIEFGLNQVIKGWTEGVQLMKEGGKSTLIIPYAMCYGAGGRPPQIPAKSDMVFDIELIEVK